MGIPSGKKSSGTSSRTSCPSSDHQNASNKDAFPHDYIRANGYILPPVEEQIMCTVYQKTPFEHRERLRNGLVNYINWRCNTSDYNHCYIDNSSKTLHLCSHIDKGLHNLDTNALSDFSNVLESDGITRLDLLWNMKPYRKWFDATPGAFTNEISA